MHLLQRLLRLVVQHAGLAHPLREVLHLPFEVRGGVAHAVLLAADLLHLPAVLEVGLGAAAELLAEVLEAAAGVLGLLAELGEVLAGRVAAGAEVVEAVAERGEAERVERRAGALGPARAVVVADLAEELDHVAGASAGEAPEGRHLLVERAAARAQPEAPEARAAARRALGEAPHQARRREAEVVGDAEAHAARRRREVAVGALEERDLGRAVAEHAQRVARRGGVRGTFRRDEADGVGAGPAEAELAHGAGGAEAERHALRAAVGPADVEPAARRRRAARLDLDADGGAAERRHVADALGERALRAPAVAGLADGHAHAAHERPQRRRERVPRRAHGARHDAVAEVGRHRLDGVHEARRARVAVAGRHPHRLGGGLAQAPHLDRGAFGQLAPGGDGRDLDVGAARHLGVAGRDGDGVGRGREKLDAGRQQACRGARERAGRAHEQQREQRQRGQREGQGAPRGRPYPDALEGHPLDLRRQAVEGGGAEGVGRRRGRRAVEVQERRQPVAHAGVLALGAGRERVLVEAGQHAQAAQQRRQRRRQAGRGEPHERPVEHAPHADAQPERRLQRQRRQRRGADHAQGDEQDARDARRGDAAADAEQAAAERADGGQAGPRQRTRRTE